MSTAIRLVRCPKCRKVLPELPNIPVYKCGGCGAILQGKKHKNDMKGNGSRARETDPIKKHEPNTSISSLEGDHPSIESSPGSDTRGDKSDSGSYISEKPVDKNILDERSHSAEPNYVQDGKSSPKTNEATVQDERERLLDQDAGLRKNEPLNHSSAKPRDRTSYELSDSCDSCNENEDSSSEVSISRKQYEERCSTKVNVVTSVNVVEDSNGVLAEEETSSGEPKSLDQHKTHFSEGNNLVDVAKEGQNIGKYTDEIEGFQVELAKEERCSGEPQSLDDPETTRSPEREPLKLVGVKNQQNIGNEIGKYTNDMEDSLGELSQEGKHSNESRSFDEPATPFSVKEPLKSDEEDKPSSEDKESSRVNEREYCIRDKDRMRQNAFSDQIDEYSQKREIAKEAASLSMKNFHEADTSLLAAEEYSIADENSQSRLQKSLRAEKDEEITAAQGSLTRSIEFAPISPDDKFLKESHEVGSNFHRISSEEMLDTSPRIPIAPVSPDDEYLEEPHEVGPSFHRISSEEERLDNLPVNPRFPIAPLSPDDEYLKEPHEVGPSFHRLSSEEERLDNLPVSPRFPIAPLSPDDEYLKEPREVGPSFHRMSSEEEKLDTLPINPRFPVAPLSPDHMYVREPHEVGPSFHRLSSEEEKLDTIIPRFPIAPLSPDDIFLEESHEVGPSFHRISSEGMLDASPINPRVPIGLMSKSPTKAYYAGDESESMYDGTEEFSAKVSRLYRRKFKEVGTMGTNRSRQKDGFRVKNRQNGELQMHNERLDFFSKFKEPNNFSGTERDWTGHESLEPMKHSRPIRTSMIAANNEPVSRGSYMPRSSQLFHGNGSPASSTHSAFFNNGEFHRPDTLLGSDPEKNELLRMVYDLEDKINRSHMSKPISGERLPFRSVEEEMRTGGYYDNPATGRNPYGDSNYSGNQRRHPQGVGWANQPRSSRLAFSGEASLCRNHIDCRCSHCYHQDLHFSPKLASHCIHCQHAAHPRHDYDNVYHSYSPSPQHYTSSEFSHDIQADNQKQDHATKMLHLREKHQVMKRHLRPVSGAAPIITCYHCSELLQLPADFILFKRRCHHLRCNSCNKILKFSFLKESHLVPYVIKIQAPPPSEMDGSSNIVDRRTMASTSRANNSQDAGPVSFSEDFEPSFSRNGSTESGPSTPSSLSIPKNLSNGKPPSNHTFQAMNDRKMKTVMEIYQDVNMRSSYNIEAAGPSSSTSTWVKPSSEIEELPTTSCPPLHRLMGYESPRQVLFARSDDDSDDGMGFFMDQQIR